MTIAFFTLLAIAVIAAWYSGHETGYKKGWNNREEQVKQVKSEPLSIEPDDELIDIIKRIDARTDSIKQGVAFLMTK